METAETQTRSLARIVGGRLSLEDRGTCGTVCDCHAERCRQAELSVFKQLIQ